MILLSVVINIAGNMGTAAPPVYRYSFSQTYSYPEKLQTYRLQQMYYVSPYTVRDFRHDASMKKSTDQKVEEEILYRYD